MKLSRRLLILSAAGALMASAQAQTSQGVSDTEIVIGTHIDLSGPAAAGMPMLRNGMQLRIDELNAAGGVHGRKIKLIVEDNASQPQQAVRAVQKLIKSDNVLAIVNPFGSGPTAATVKMATDAGVMVFAPWAASGIIQKVSANSPLLFTTVQNYDTTTANGLSWAVKNWKSQKVGVIYQEGPFGDLVRAGVNQALKDAGQTVAAEAAYKVGDIDFSSQVAKMKAANVDLIVAGTLVRESVGVMTEVKKLNWSQVKVLTTIPGRSTIVAKLGKEATEGMYGIGGWKLHDPDTSDAAAKKFMTDFKAKFNMDADENAANAYSYTSWFIAGLQAAGRNLNSQSLAKAMPAVAHQDFTTFSRQTFVNNHVGQELASIDQIKGGKWVQIAPPSGK
ncbi:ABC transporter substrate-binding protein [Limnohabitans sp. T6-5]|uniref:ABC transporter substrate-binding protein n=1 Tax=Limnohabitans sp. T6-5 TaxID=1100724 RepID=UPI001304A4BB|nr:ABC transporter substrate-binding protein [Limnohabitans sp. T6-5]